MRFSSNAAILICVTGLVCALVYGYVDEQRLPPRVERPAPAALPQAEELTPDQMQRRQVAHADSLVEMRLHDDAQKAYYRALEIAADESEKVSILIKIARIEVSFFSADRARDVLASAKQIAERYPTPENLALYGCGGADLARVSSADTAALALYTQCELLAGQAQRGDLVLHARMARLVLAPASAVADDSSHLVAILSPHGQAVTHAVLEAIQEERECRQGALTPPISPQSGLWNNWRRYVPACSYSRECWHVKRNIGYERQCRTEAGGIARCPLHKRFTGDASRPRTESARRAMCWMRAEYPQI